MSFSDRRSRGSYTCNELSSLGQNAEIQEMIQTLAKKKIIN